MCGIVGLFQEGAKELELRAKRMADALSHRGPDDSGVWCDSSIGLVLGHRRLSIIDLSPAGHQPMESADARYIIVFNGEIYNYREVLAELEISPEQLRGHSDTEVMLLAIERWGIEKALKSFNGMFALAVWDKKLRELSLARDRVGKKPLYYGWSAGAFYFASELKALVANPAFQAQIDRDVVALLMRYSYVPHPHSIYKGVFQLAPATFISFGLADLKAKPNSFSPFVAVAKGVHPRSYWSLKEQIDLRQDNGKGLCAGAALELFEEKLSTAVKLRMIADVPIGAFLSGGIDSSLVVALMQRQSTRPVRTFSIGFPELGFDEAPYAKAISKHLGAEHTELYVSAHEALEIIPKLPIIFDEPFADSSQIPTHLVSVLTRRHVTVSLSGDGGDELFGGYNRYIWANKAWGILNCTPRMLRRLASMCLRRIPPNTWQKCFDLFHKVLPSSLHFKSPGEKFHKLARLLELRSRGELYRMLMSHWEDSHALIPDAAELNSAITSEADWPSHLNYLELMMFIDFLSYLPDDILVKVDRSSMAASLETRAPILDYRVVEFAWSLPVEFKVRSGISKWIMRKLLAKFVPEKLFERPKMGFAVPMNVWLRGPLREWAEDLLTESRLKREGYFNVDAVRSKWLEHLSGKRDWQYYLWDVLMFESWLANRGRG